MVNDPSLKYFDPEKQINLSVDTSKIGFGPVIMQKRRLFRRGPWQKHKWDVPSWKRVISWFDFSWDKFYQFIYGNRLITQIDHTPTTNIWHRYALQIEKELTVVDTLSRANSQQEYNEKFKLEAQVHLGISVERIME